MRRVDPGLRAVGAGDDHSGEVAVDADLEVVAAGSCAQAGGRRGGRRAAGCRAAADRPRRARPTSARLRHRKDAGGIGLQQERRSDLGMTLVAHRLSVRGRASFPASGCCSRPLWMSGSSRSSWKSGVVVSTPSTMSSLRRRRSRASASSRVAAVDDQLADQAVVVGRDRVAVVDGAVHAHAEAAGRVVGA